ncbi:hypothetical protein IEO_03077 [Bacillus wiedmannii]|uniref:hypothetical protein n=1 Tax=Bacillus wiedmannii TaxID=1890302 RepID=UPI00027C016D|nr:hypothetical protein [Bacillus wiedmannii]EJV61782.1 hypothetical protein IEO_03077 [Bacillus wiedmannii]
MTILAWVVIAISLMFIVAVTTNKKKYDLSVRITTIVLFSPSLLLSILYLIN